MFLGSPAPSMSLIIKEYLDMLYKYYRNAKSYTACCFSYTHTRRNHLSIVLKLQNSFSSSLFLECLLHLFLWVLKSCYRFW